MVKLLLTEGTFYSPLDESAFFEWLKAIPGVVSVAGIPAGLEVTLRSKRLSQQTLRDLLAIHFRYDLAMKDLAQFETPQNRSWFYSPQAYWHSGVFGQ